MSSSGRLDGRGGVRCPAAPRNRGRVSGRHCPPRTLPQPAGVRYNRNRLPGRRRLVGCSQRRKARHTCQPSRWRSCSRTYVMAGRFNARASSPISPPSLRPLRSPRRQAAITASAAAHGSTLSLAQVSVARRAAPPSGRAGTPARGGPGRGGRSAVHTGRRRPAAAPRDEAARRGRPPAHRPPGRGRPGLGVGRGSSPAPRRAPGPRRARWRQAAPLAPLPLWMVGTRLPGPARTLTLGRGFHERHRREDRL
jgi:hypothetical protein